ncbi:unnamed protein product, partial [Adineta ricciae]
MFRSSPCTITFSGCSESIASFAQKRIWQEENLSCDAASTSTTNNVLIPLVLKEGVMPIERIYSAVIAILEHITVLRTAIYFDERRNDLVQSVKPIISNDSCLSFQVTKKSTLTSDMLDNLLEHEVTHPFAKVDCGLVVRCHLIQTSFNDDEQYLKTNDLILFVFHRIAFDCNSVSPFISAFRKAYDRLSTDTTNLQYIDFTLYESMLFANMSENEEIQRALEFWSKLINDYCLRERYPLPIASKSSVHMRSQEKYTTTFVLDSSLVKAQTEFATSHKVSMFHLQLACFFLFIYELNDASINDLCVTCSTQNRLIDDIKSMVGMFDNLIPYRIKINANSCFSSLVQQIWQLSADIFNHFQLPYQLIVAKNKDLCSTTIPFHFSYHLVSLDSFDNATKSIQTNDAILSLSSHHTWLYRNSMVPNDCSLAVTYNDLEHMAYCTLQCSSHWCSKDKLLGIGQFYQNLLLHVFNGDEGTTNSDPTMEQIGNLFLLQSGYEISSELMSEIECSAKS